MIENRLRVLLIETQGRGGIWHYACSMATALARSGLRVALATSFPYEDLELNRTVRVCVVDRANPRWASLPRVVRRMGNHAGKVARLWHLIREFQPDIVHFHSQLGKLDFLYYRFLRASGIRVVYTAHDARPLRRHSNWFDRARCHEANAVLVHSLNSVEELVTDGIPSSKIKRIPHGNYLHFCSQATTPASDAKQRLNLPTAARVLLFFGSIAPYKGVDMLVDAFARLRAELSDLYLIIAGMPLEDFAPYRSQIERLGLTERICLDLRYIPFREFPNYFSCADVVVLPYRRIYQSGVLQLAYGFGRPVVVTNVGGLAEAVLEDQTGAVATTSDGKGLAGAIREVLADPQAAAEMGARGRRLAETKYSWDSVVQQLDELYRAMAPERCQGVGCRRGESRAWLRQGRN